MSSAIIHDSNLKARLQEPGEGAQLCTNSTLSVTASATGRPSDGDALPVFDLEEVLARGAADSEGASPFCLAVARCLEETGCLIVRDPRVGTGEADRFLDLMERYFGQPDAAKAPDVHPELHYQAPLACTRTLSQMLQMWCLLCR